MSAKTGFANKPYATITNTRRTKYTWTNTLNYSFTLKDDHNISLLVGHEMQHDQTTTNQQGSRYFTEAFDKDPEKVFDSMGQGIPYLSYSAKNTPNRMMSFFGQANYNYKHKYLLSLTMRADGSTKFAPGHQWGYFPSVSGAWVVSEEPWWNKDIASQFKIRAAFGLAGNNDIGDDRWRYVYGINSNGGPSWNEGTENGEKYYSVGSAFPNEEIKWETTITRNLALDLGFFKNRLTITPEFYWNTTRDLLYTSYIATTSGFGQQTRNVGKVTNKGFEVTVNYNILQKKDFTLDANLTMGYNKSKVDQLNGEDNTLWSTSNRWKSSYDDFCLKVGDEVGLIYGFVYDGLYSFDEFDQVNYNYIPKVDENGKQIPVEGLSATGGTAPGRIKFKDLNNDGKIDENDRTVIGDPNPDIYGNIHTTLNYKNLTLSAVFNYSLGNDIFNYQRSLLEGGTYFLNQTTAMKNRWTTEGQKTDYPRAEYKDPMGNARFSDRWIEDGSYLRLSNLTLSYYLPIQSTYLQGITIFGNVSNLFTITKYLGSDPDCGIAGNILTQGIDRGLLGKGRSFSVGVNINL